MKSNKVIVAEIREHIKLFDLFEHVYLFGSVLDSSAIYNDIDILTIYKEYSGKIEKQLKVIADELGKVCGSFIDLTALSIEEEKDITLALIVSRKIMD
jgi:predicted nucleotidyltransferase